jgi:glyoxylase-like metal-dependent hydrolase (beta-lactamase superfamily II)/ferredoxin
MARPSRRLNTNVPGPFFVDAACIDCGTCWQWDPDHFSSSGAQARVHSQPMGPAATQRALLALQACPVAAIGAPAELRDTLPADGFPAALCEGSFGQVYYCGWASRRSFGASSYLIVRPTGNVLIDSPRWSAPLARRIAALGGLKAIVLSHRDDVADHHRWAKAFGCPRWIHSADADAAPGAEMGLEGDRPLELDPELRLIPTPGHTAGSLVALLSDQVLFSGDHLWWSDRAGAVVASRDYCWWDWSSQLRSVAILRDLDVRWLFPGHGGRRHFEAGEWRRQLDQLLDHWNHQAQS